MAAARRGPPVGLQRNAGRHCRRHEHVRAGHACRIAAQIEFKGASVRHGDAHAGTVHLGDGLERRARRYQVGCLDLHVGCGEVDGLRALWLSAEEPHIPHSARGGVGQRRRIGIGQERDGDTQPLAEFASQVRSDTARLAGHRVGGGEQEVTRGRRGPRAAYRSVRVQHVLQQQYCQSWRSPVMLTWLPGGTDSVSWDLQEGMDDETPEPASRLRLMAPCLSRR